MNQDDHIEKSDSEPEIFSIKDPRPITAKQKSVEKESDDVAEPDEPENEQNSADNEMSQSDEPQIVDEPDKSTAKAPAKTKTKPKKKVGKKLSSDAATPSQSTSVLKPTESPAKPKQKMAKDSNLPSSKRKRKTPMQTKSGNSTRNSSIGSASSDHNKPNQETKSKGAQKDPQSSGSKHCKTAQTKPRKPNYEHISRLSESKNCNRAGHGCSWFNPEYTFEEVTKTNEESVPEPMETSETSNIPQDLRPEEHLQEQESSVADQLSPKLSDQSSSSANLARARVRYTNLSLSMPATREGRRKEEEDSKCGWLFECKNIWTDSRSGHQYSKNYQKISTGYQYKDQMDNSHSEAVNPLGTNKTRNRFMHSMKNRATNRVSIMRTVKQGSFVLMGTVKTIGDDNNRLPYNF